MNRAARFAGIAGPAAFVGAWVVGGAVKDGYSPVSDTISRLAEQGASTQPLMTAGFLGFGLLMPVFARGLGRALGSRSVQVAVTASAVGTLAVAAFPLSPEGGTTVDTLHLVAAGASYAANVLGPIAAAPHLRARTARLGSYALSVAMAAALVGSLVVDDQTGLLQRTGLTMYDAWAVALALSVLGQQRRPAGRS
ncbi:DUF998 domain-containing protein [Sporichthya sp.]|uniref:DUF998 domain-containing protein n=1 Tax=Sporichthya sp. TaxID=65475 RepID=UPI00179EBC8F|nr:DUF998 domain-containing protein [Sporichthya sp.]MBA3743878.1 DUF998 domain-containing protein [Sporichthya sp.]